MVKLPIFTLLLLLGTVGIFADISSPSCEEGNNKELVCSQEVLAAINREQQRQSYLSPKNMMKELEITAAPLKTTLPPEENVGIYDDGEYYDEGEYYE